MPTEEGSERCQVAGFEDGGRGLQAEKCGQPLQDGKVKRDSPLELP